MSMIALSWNNVAPFIVLALGMLTAGGAVAVVLFVRDRIKGKQ